MALIKVFDLPNAKLALWNITESEQELMMQLSESERIILESYKSPSRRVESASWRALVHQLYPGFEIEYNDLGAPRFKGETGLSLSVSHSAGCAAVLVSHSCSCGVDLELSSRDVRKVVSRFLSETEFALKTDDSFEIVSWCAKEATYKFIAQAEIDWLTDMVVSSYDKDSQSIEITVFGVRKLDLKFEFFDKFVLVYII